MQSYGGHNPSGNAPGGWLFLGCSDDNSDEGGYAEMRNMLSTVKATNVVVLAVDRPLSASYFGFL